MKYINPKLQKVRNAHALLVCCSQCRTDLLVYLKGGSGGLIKIQCQRIIESIFDPQEMGRGLHCPTCGEHLGSLRDYRGWPTYYLIRSKTMTRRLQHYQMP